MGEIFLQLGKSLRIFFDRIHLAAVGNQGSLHRHRASTGADVVDTGIPCDAQLGKSHRADFLLGHRNRLFGSGAQKFAVVQSQRRVVAGRCDRMLNQHDRQRVKALLCQLLGGAGKDALLRVGQLFADPHLRVAQSLLTQLFADILRSLVAAGQHKHPRMAAHLRRDRLGSAVDAEKLDVVPAGL